VCVRVGRRVKVAQLERDNKLLRAGDGGGDGGGDAAVLNTLLTETQTAKDKLEAVRPWATTR
jgi:hypothetical protein